MPMDFSNLLGPIRLLLVFTLLSCSSGKDLDYQENIPSATNNPVSKEGIRLGEKIFFLEFPGSDHQASCASCHKPDSGFSKASMDSINGTKRQVPSLFNLAWSKAFFWDGRESNLESVVIKPLVGHEEMNVNLTDLVSFISRDKNLKSEFQVVFGTDSIYFALVARALAQYVRSLIRPVQNQTTNHVKGKALFDAHCKRCHSGSGGTDFEMRKSVIAASGSDSGRFKVSGRMGDVYVFKTPGMVDLKLTAPYMHDGRFSSIEEVLENYSEALTLKELKVPAYRLELISYLNEL